MVAVKIWISHGGMVGLYRYDCYDRKEPHDSLEPNKERDLAFSLITSHLPTPIGMSSFSGHKPGGMFNRKANLLFKITCSLFEFQMEEQNVSIYIFQFVRHVFAVNDYTSIKIYPSSLLSRKDIF